MNIEKECLVCPASLLCATSVHVVVNLCSSCSAVVSYYVYNGSLQYARTEIETTLGVVVGFMARCRLIKPHVFKRGAAYCSECESRYGTYVPPD